MSARPGVAEIKASAIWAAARPWVVRVKSPSVKPGLSLSRGVFAPRHVGELIQYLPFELVDDVGQETAGRAGPGGR